MANPTPPPGLGVVATPLTEFVDRYHQIRTNRDTENKLIEDIVIYCQTVEMNLRQENEQLNRSLHDMKLDLDDATRSRREMQGKLARCMELSKSMETEWNNLRARNPYIMVLIDGDGLIFNDEYLRQGLEGGKKAANALRSAVLEHRLPDLPDNVEVIVKICANVTGLAKALKRNGSVDNPDDLLHFTLGFTQNKASFDFIDVGHGKERADSKLKENLRWHVRNYNCRQLILGISHDAGYAPFLDEHIGQEEREKISILEGPPTVHELQLTGIRIERYEGIFRSDKLVDRGNFNTVGVLAQKVTVTAPSSVISIPYPTLTTARPTSTLQPASWASTAISAPSSSPLTSMSGLTIPLKDITNTPTSTTDSPKWKPQPRGLDSPLNPSLATINAIRSRHGPDKLCNNHYLRSTCYTANCPFTHNYKASEADLEALKYLSRLNPCTAGQYCEDWTCIYGHHCPAVKTERRSGSGEERVVCASFACKFEEEDHPPGVVNMGTKRR